MKLPTIAIAAIIALPATAQDFETKTGCLEQLSKEVDRAAFLNREDVQAFDARRLMAAPKNGNGHVELILKAKRVIAEQQIIVAEQMMGLCQSYP